MMRGRADECLESEGVSYQAVDLRILLRWTDVNLHLYMLPSLLCSKWLIDPVFLFQLA